MKKITLINIVAMTSLVLNSIAAFAYNDDKEKEICRNPKVQEFTLPEYHEPDKKEVPPEAEFSFVVSGWAEPKKFKLSAKNVNIPFTVQSADTFHKVKAKLPAALTGQSVRINARIPAVLGCYTTIGWLIKVADKPGTGMKAEANLIEKPKESKPEAALAPAAVAKSAPTATAIHPSTEMTGTAHAPSHDAPSHP